MKTIKAVALLSGGLDSIIAAHVVRSQGIEVTGIYFSSPFWSNEKKEKTFIEEVKKQNQLDIKIVPVGDEYMEIIKHPEYGWGKGINPCVDCKVFMLRRAKQIMIEMGASFLITGEVVGQRPMSQHKSALNYIEKHAHVRGILLRPLSAKLLPPTKPETEGLVDREKLLDISGRSRKNQTALAKQYGVQLFTSPAGGCLLTQKAYSHKLRDLFDHHERPTMRDAALLKYGRHFRFKKSKIIVGRDQGENALLLSLKGDDDYCFEMPTGGSPVTLLSEDINKESIQFAASLTHLYSDSEDLKAPVKCEHHGKIEEIIVQTFLTKEDVVQYNLSR